MECPVCIEKFNKSSRKVITCSYCENRFCLVCVKTYILNSYNEPDCMNCHKIWNNDFLLDNLTKTFINDELKKHRENMLFEKEKSLLPSTQIVIEKMKEKKELFDKIEQAYEEIEKIRQELNQKLKPFEKTIEQCREFIRVIDNKPDAEKKKFVRACPAPDCRGFLSTNYKCGLCNIYVCPDCKEIKGIKETDEHTCDPDILASAKQIESDSKNCPSCSALIYKIEGCDMMFCVQCNTSFGWKTGKIITSGPIHNPHYFEWVRKTGGANVRNEGDVPCGGLPAIRIYLVNLNRVIDKDLRLKLNNIYRIVNHITDITIPRYRTVVSNDNNQDLRLKYLTKEITESEFKRQLQIREKKFKKNIAIRQVLDTFVAVATENLNMINDLMSESKISFDDINKNVKNIDDIKDYIHNCFEKIASNFGCKTPLIDANYDRVI